MSLPEIADHQIDWGETNLTLATTVVTSNDDASSTYRNPASSKPTRCWLDPAMTPDWSSYTLKQI